MMNPTVLETKPQVRPEDLRSCLEVYNAEVPKGVLALTAGVAVFKNRLEYEVVGWGERFESWSIDWGAIHGDPTNKNIWDILYQRLNKVYQHEDGKPMPIGRTFIDSGFLPRQVLAFVQDKDVDSSVSMCKVVYGEHPLVSSFSNDELNDMDEREEAPLYFISHDRIKSFFYKLLNNRDVYPFHFRYGMNSDAYFSSLTSQQYIKLEGGWFWVNQQGRDTDALDLRLFALAAWCDFKGYKEIEPPAKKPVTLEDLNRRLSEVEKVLEIASKA